MTGALGNLVVPLVFALVLVLMRVASRTRRHEVRRTLERAAATKPVATKPVAATPVPAKKPAPNPPRPAVRPAPRAAAPVTPAAPFPDRSAGPRWAANAIVAAEVFGPPVSARPGGTLGPPHAL